MLLVKSTHTKHLHKIFIKNSKDTQHLLISHYTCNGVNDITWLQFFIKWNISTTKHGNKNLQKKLLYSFKSSFIQSNKKFDATATLNVTQNVLKLVFSN